MDKQQKQQTVFYKEEFKWHYISTYFDSLIGTLRIDDEEFNRLFKQVQDYIETKIFQFDSGLTVDMFVVIEHMLSSNTLEAEERDALSKQSGELFSAKANERD